MLGNFTQIAEETLRSDLKLFPEWSVNIIAGSEYGRRWDFAAIKCAGVLELEYKADLKFVEKILMRVRVPSPAL